MMSLLPVVLLIAQVNPSTPGSSKPDLVRAKRVFENNCASCHGADGSGGKGPSLSVPKLRRARTDKELESVIAYGIGGTEMPPFWYLGQESLDLLKLHVRALGANATPPLVQGDVSKGKRLFYDKGGCAACHTVGAEGRAYGPDLSDVGARRGSAALRQSLAEPNADIVDGFVLVRAVTAQGEKVDGIRVNQDNFSIQILQPSGRFRSFRKDALSELHEYPNESAMPSYETIFSEGELQDLVAYLSSLRGEP
jgi:putative heme-binding domain-containing protein